MTKRKNVTDDIFGLLRRPSAWLPIILSIVALAMVLGYATLFGTVQGAQPHDEGTPARLFQLLMTASALAVVFFAARWLPRAPRQAATIIVLQVLVACLPVAVILLLES